MQEVTLARPATQAQALSCFAQWRGKPLPVSATSWSGDADGGEGMLCVRLSGAPPALASARQQIGGDAMEPDAAQAWWRCCASRPTPSSNPASRCGGWPCRRPPPRSISVRRCWSGAAASAGFVAITRRARERAASSGHATLFRPAGMSVPEDGVFHPLAPALALITRRLKQELDPAGLFNPGRLILEL